MQTGRGRGSGTSEAAKDKITAISPLRHGRHADGAHLAAVEGERDAALAKLVVARRPHGLLEHVHAGTRGEQEESKRGQNMNGERLPPCRPLLSPREQATGDRRQPAVVATWPRHTGAQAQPLWVTPLFSRSLTLSLAAGFCVSLLSRLAPPSSRSSRTTRGTLGTCSSGGPSPPHPSRPAPPARPPW